MLPKPTACLSAHTHRYICQNYVFSIHEGPKFLVNCNMRKLGPSCILFSAELRLSPYISVSLGQVLGIKDIKNCCVGSKIMDLQINGDEPSSLELVPGLTYELICASTGGFAQGAQIWFNDGQPVNSTVPQSDSSAVFATPDDMEQFEEKDHSDTSTSFLQIVSRCRLLKFGIE